MQEGGKTFEDDIVDSLEQCLSDLGIMHCLPTLKEWGIDSVEDLAELNDDDITELELKKIQHRKFIKFIASLKSWQFKNCMNYMISYEITVTVYMAEIQINLFKIDRFYQ